MATQGLQYNDLVKAQQGMTRDQIADKANQIVPIKPVQNTAIPADQLGTGTAIKLPQPNPDTTAADGVVGGATQATKGIQDYLKEITPPETDTSKSYNDLLGQINTLLPNLANKGQDQLQQEKNVGLPDLKKNLAALNAQILSRTAEYEKAYTGEELRVAPIGNIVGRQAALRRNQASEIGLLQARALGLQGQVEMAQETANRAIDLKYDTLKDQLEVKMQQLQLVQPILDKEEKRYGAALELKYRDEQQKLEEQRAKAKEIFGLAVQNGVKTPFVNIAGTVYRVSDGKEYSTPQEFFQDGGARDFSNATPLQALTEPLRVGPGDTIIDPITGEVLFQSPVTPNFQANPLTGELFDSKTGLSPSGFNTNATGMRTDRHNNPTAMTTDVARSLGLVEGQDYVKGDAFPDNPNLFTAKFLGDPIQTTIKALDTAARSSDTQAFYTKGGQQRWTYIGISDQEWLSLSQTDKQAVIAQMYQQEGGNGSLIGQAPQNGDVIGNLVTQVQSNPNLLYTLPDVQQKAVIARMAQSGIAIPDKPAEISQPNQLSGSELGSWQGTIDRYFESGTGLGEVRSIIDNSHISQNSKEALKQYAESTWPQYQDDDKGFWSKLLDSLN